MRASSCAACFAGKRVRRRDASSAILMRSTATGWFTPHAVVVVVNAFGLRAFHRLKVIVILETLPQFRHESRLAARRHRIDGGKDFGFGAHAQKRLLAGGAVKPQLPGAGSRCARTLNAQRLTLNAQVMNQIGTAFRYLSVQR